jgi:predicted DNA-binding ribbon-helix-helix protein
MASVRLEDLLRQFLEDLARASTEELLAEIEEARENSKDSWIIDEEQQ